jgi:hypothetical protein
LRPFEVHHFGQFGASPLELLGQNNKALHEREGRKMSKPVEEAESPEFEEITRRIHNMRRLAEERERESGQLPAPTEPKPKGKVVQFPLPFGEDTRAVSNPLARCALFAPVKERQHVKDYVTVGEWEGMKIETKGEQLNQDDNDVFLLLVKMASHKPLGEDVCQRVNAVLHELGRANHKSQRKQLFAEIDRLVTTPVRVTMKGYPSIIGNLLDDASTPQDQATLPEFRRHLAYRLNPKFARFFGGTLYSLFNQQDRLKLKGRGSELAKWLHLWIIGNAEQYPHRVETIREKCGSRIKDLKEFRRNLRQALDLLKEAGIIAAWRIDPATDLVYIERTPSPPQLGHLTKKARKRRPKGQKKG